MKKYLGLDEDEMKQNQILWRQENNNDAKPEISNQSEMSSVGVRGGDLDSFSPTDLGDEGTGDEGGDFDDQSTESPISGDEGGTDDEI